MSTPGGGRSTQPRSGSEGLALGVSTTAPEGPALNLSGDPEGLDLNISMEIPEGPAPNISSASTESRGSYSCIRRADQCRQGMIVSVLLRPLG